MNAISGDNDVIAIDNDGMVEEEKEIIEETDLGSGTGSKRAFNGENDNVFDEPPKKRQRKSENQRQQSVIHKLVPPLPSKKYKENIGFLHVWLKNFKNINELVSTASSNCSAAVDNLIKAMEHPEDRDEMEKSKKFFGNAAQEQEKAVGEMANLFKQFNKSLLCKNKKQVKCASEGASA